MVSVMRDMRHHHSPEPTPRPAATRRAPPSPVQKEAPAAARPATPSRPFPWRQTLRAGVWIVGLSCLGGAGWAGWNTLRQPNLLPIQTLHFEGLSSKVPLSAVNHAVAPFVGQGFLWVNLDQLRERLEHIPWVASADVRRVWPGRLSITLHTFTPAARWLGAGDAVMDAQGKIFTVPGEQIPTQLPELYGPPQDGQAIWQRLQHFNTLLAPLGLTVRSLEEDARGGWRCILSNGVRLVLGSQKVDAALQRWVAVAPEVKGYLVPGATMDLRYNNGFAVALPTATTSSVSSQ